MNTKVGVFKISKTFYVDTDPLEETIRNKKVFLDWSNVSTFDSYEFELENKQSFYPFNCKCIERQEEIDRLINKLLLPFLYYSISEHKKNHLKEV